jgi:hypothetical protein
MSKLSYEASCRSPYTCEMLEQLFSKVVDMAFT